MLDLVIANARLPAARSLVDIGIRNGLIAAIEPQIAADAPRVNATGQFTFGGFADCHIHLDKADILDRCSIAEGTLAEAVRETARAKAGFTVEDVHRRASGVVRKAVSHGTTSMRTFVEIDPRAGMRSFEAVKAVRSEFAAMIDIEICAFAQEGLTNEPETEGMLAAALADGADLVGGCSYTDPSPSEHIKRIFDLAERFDVDADFHIDFDLDPRRPDLDIVIAETQVRRYGGRVTCGHVTKLSAMTPAEVTSYALRLANAGIAVVALPATDLFLLGRDRDKLVPRGVAPLMALARQGVTTAVATNNVLNPFTPYGDANPLRMANLFANLTHLSRDGDLQAAFDMVTINASTIMGRKPGLRVGDDADLVIVEASDGASAVRSIAPIVGAWKCGRRSPDRGDHTLA